MGSAEAVQIWRPLPSLPRVTSPLGDLGFQRGVLDIVAPVLAEFGFAVSERGHREVCFRSAAIWACVFHEERSEQIGFHFDRLGDPSENGAYSVPSAMRLVDPVGAAKRPEPSARTAEEVRLALDGLKGDIESFCAQVLRNDAAAFTAMKRASDLRIAQFGDWTTRMQEMRRSGAIERGDWGRVVEVYESAQHELEDSDQLEVARQNVRTLRECEPAFRTDAELLAEMAKAFVSFGHFDGTDDERRRLELGVAQAMDARDWKSVIGLYEATPYELEYLQFRRLEIAHSRLRVRDGHALQPPRRGIPMDRREVAAWRRHLTSALDRAADVAFTQYTEMTWRAQEEARGAAVDRGDWQHVVEIHEAAKRDANFLLEQKLQIARQNARTLDRCEPALRDDPELFTEMAKAYRTHGHFDGTDDDRQRIELAVGDAMDARDWPRVVELYESTPFDLEPLQLVRLEIARRQLGGTGA